MYPQYCRPDTTLSSECACGPDPVAVATTLSERVRTRGCRVCRLDRSRCRESDSVPRGPVPNQRSGTDLSDSFPGGPPEPPCADARINVVLARGAFYRNVSPGLTPSFLKNQAAGQNRVKAD